MTHIMSTARETKKLQFTCEQCRKRKVKCNGREPRCDRCEARGEECEYKQSPTLAYTHSLEKRVEELEAEIQALRAGAADKTTLEPESSPEKQHPPINVMEPSRPRVLKGLNLDEKGVPIYHGSTSLFHRLDSSIQNGSTSGIATEISDPLGAESRQRLVLNAWEQRAQESLSQIPEPFRYLLNLHWCWIQPLFNFIYRPAFTRDMAMLGPYYSHTLMNALLAHSVRWGIGDEQTRQLLSAYDDGKVFARQAWDGIFKELREGVCTISTVQALLLLSAQECSHGNSTQAWVCTGIAFRLIDHLGISFDSQRFMGSVALSDEDSEIRRRLFWSCYFWDKLMSLYLGRSPSLQQSPASPPQRILDDSAEDELWTPHGLTYTDGEQYPPTPSHSTSSFIQICRLTVIFNEILIHMYDPTYHNSDIEMHSCLIKEEASLNSWWAELPPFLKMEVSDLPRYAPPSHIVILNLLYHCFRILLYRPMLSRRSSPESGPLEPNPNHLRECVSSATAIIAIFDLYYRTFGESHCTISVAYCVYIASSIFLLQVQATPSDHQAARRLEFCALALASASRINPIIRSALKLVMEAINDLGIEMAMPFEPQPLTGATPATCINSPLQSQAFLSSIDSGQLPFTYEPEFVGLDQLQFGHLDVEDLGISPEMFQAVLSLEPMTVRLEDLNDQGF
ncbi:unnamed protein product [Clonostachys rosea f. rosea IK726]|uniref:Zn(2)-C6 fungal-type domain-containing protein n=2 Tax=Bionectria ochroleuca TaxID=29856 RepID=A0A0B7JS74_BIOOC|nr:unnamed protein product [Clonostachys rosea f. rosea IK726]